MDEELVVQTRKAKPYYIYIPLLITIFFLTVVFGITNQWLIMYLCSTKSTSVYSSIFAQPHSNPDWEECRKNPEYQALASQWNSIFQICSGIPGLITVPWLGILSDKYGRKPMLLLSVLNELAVILGYIAVSYFNFGLWVVVLGYLIEGLLGSYFILINNTFAYLADTTDSIDRSKYFVVAEGVILFSFGFGPMVGGILNRNLDPQTVFVISFFGTTSALISFALLLPESLDFTKVKTASLTVAQSITKMVNVVKQVMSPTFVYLLCGICATAISFDGKKMMFFYNSYVFGWDSQDEGMYALAGSLLRVGNLMFIYPLLTKLFAKKMAKPKGKYQFELDLVRLALFSAASSALLISIAKQGWVLYVISILDSFGVLANPTLRSLLSGSASPVSQGMLFASVSAVDQILKLGFNVIYPLIWSATVDFKPNTFLLVVAAFNILGGVALMQPTAQDIVDTRHSEADSEEELLIEQELQ
ncbi:hypothetical protein HDV06_003000 [Boothiomyces sp. JEL0866]|nr:hypothetical protein HDV06_000396 [Boothiomyces sp. JEL0866]KAJ3322456.1 hypothetical protein HDV06_003000 [Boothiomyces sp. JEL0866]